MNLNVGGERVHITWTSMFWFLTFTAIGTVIGEAVYQKYVLPRLQPPAQPALGAYHRFLPRKR